MSYNANYQILIQVHELNNIYMRRQGFASIRIEIVDQSALGLNYAVPSSTLKPKRDNSKIVKDAWVEGNAWMSPIMRIQYLDQIIQLNDVARFELSTSLFPQLENQNIYLRFTLLFQKLHDFSSSLSPSQHGIQTIIIKIKNIQSGIFHYGQNYFTDQYYSKFSFTCFAINSFYSLSPQLTYPKEKSRYLSKMQKQLSNILTLEELIKWHSTYIGNDKDGNQSFYELYLKNLWYNSQLLRIRVNENYKIKRETAFRLPKFMKLENEKVKQKQFFEAFANFRCSQVLIGEYKQSMQEMKEMNDKFVQEVQNGLVHGVYNIRKLREQYNRYDRQKKTWRMMKAIECQSSYKQYSKARDVVDDMRHYRKLVLKQNEYPLQFQNRKRQIFMNYTLYLPPQFAGKQLSAMKNKMSYCYDQTKMIVVICHGYLSSAAEMRMLKRGINSALPLANILTSKSNEVHTQDCIQQMGKRLATQINQFITKHKFNSAEVILNFVGHSMGGIIARACFKHIPHLHQRFGFYCSIGTPHLGYLNGGLTKAGLWVIRQVKKQCKSLDQLSMYEAQHPELSFLYNLSFEGNLQKFKKVILMSSAEDKFVPWHSARICSYKKKKVNNQLQDQMIENILGKMPTHRIDINFGMLKSDIQTMIGRKAHLNLITHYQIFDLVNQVLPQLFDIRQI